MGRLLRRSSGALTYSSYEREYAPEVAISAGIASIMREEMSIRLASPWSAGESRDILCEGWRSGRMLAGGRGKGVGNQSLASALFELIEHSAALDSDVSSAASVLISRDKLNALHLEKDSLLRTFATEIGTNIFPSQTFEPLNGDNDSKHYYPSAMVDFGHDASALTSVPLRRISNYRSTSGYGAGMSKIEASLHCLYEVIERDAFSAFLVSILSKNPLLDEYAQPPELYSQLAPALGSQLRSNIRVFRLPSLIGTVAMAHCGTRDQGGRLDIGLGCSLNANYAIERAVLELQQEYLAGQTIGALSDDFDFLRFRRLARFPNLYRAARTPEPEAKTTIRPTRNHASSPTEALNYVTESLRGLRLEPLVRTVWCSDEGPTVCQVYVPGCEKFHLIRHGLATEPHGRLRSSTTVDLCRRRSRGEP